MQHRILRLATAGGLVALAASIAMPGLASGQRIVPLDDGKTTITGAVPGTTGAAGRNSVWLPTGGRASGVGRDMTAIAVYLSQPRGATARERLRIDWTFPSHRRERGEQGALPMKKALASIAGKDPRPLLVVRECEECLGTEDALLKRDGDNEKTIIMSQWFHCVKLRTDVKQADHPYHALFADHPDSHVFVSGRTGAGRVDLKKSPSPSDLWKGMEAVVAKSYEKSATRAVRDILRLFDKADRVDAEVGQLEDKLDDLLEKKGPGDTKTKKAQKNLAKSRAERAKLHEELAQAAALPLKSAKKTAPAAAPAASSVGTAKTPVAPKGGGTR